MTADVYVIYNLYAGVAELAELAEDTRVQAMAEYPYYGSVQKIDNYIVVKLG